MGSQEALRVQLCKELVQGIEASLRMVSDADIKGAFLEAGSPPGQVSEGTHDDLTEWLTRQIVDEVECLEKMSEVAAIASRRVADIAKEMQEEAVAT